MIELVSPLGFPRVEAQKERRALGNPAGRRVGFIWNQYPATRMFWPHLERALEAIAKPWSVERAYKRNTWMPLEAPDFNKLARAVDYLVIGVGA